MYVGGFVTEKDGRGEFVLAADLCLGKDRLEARVLGLVVW